MARQKERNAALHVNSQPRSLSENLADNEVGLLKVDPLSNH